MKKILKKLYSLMLISTILFSSSSVFSAVDIIDVKPTDNAYLAVKNVVEQKLMNLFARRFLPDNNVKRGEFARILANINGDMQRLVEPSKPYFQDVPKGNEYYSYIETEKKYIPNFGNTFKPDLDLSREDAAYAIVKSMGYDTDKAIKDGVQPDIKLDSVVADGNKVSKSLEKYVSIAAANELIDLVTKNNNLYIEAKRYITRKELALLLDKACQMGDYTKEINIKINDFKSSKKTESTVTFSWTAAANPKSIAIYQSIKNGNWVKGLTDTISAGSKQATVKDLKPETAYKFKLVVTGGENEGDSNIIDVTTLKAKSNKPVVINPTISTNTKVNTTKGISTDSSITNTNSTNNASNANNANNNNNNNNNNNSSNISANQNTNTTVKLNIKAGQYVQIGKFNGQPILWRVIDNTSNGVMAITERIITMKCFDAAESGVRGNAGGIFTKDDSRQKFGSNRWSNSNIREWLNSSSYQIFYTTQAPVRNAQLDNYNPYENEPGFLSNLTIDETAILQDTDVVTDKPLVDGGGTETTTDKVFLLSEEEWRKYMVKDSDGGRAKPTQEAVDKCEWKDPGYFNASQYWCYWLRTPNPGNSYTERYVVLDGTLNFDEVNSTNHGARPVINIRQDSKIVSGDGSYSNPFVFVK